MSFLGHKFRFDFFKRKKIAGSELCEALSDQEKQILELISIGKSYQTIADELMISKDEVQKRIREIYRKLQNSNIKKDK